MRVRNVHQREVPATAERLGSLIDGLGSARDRLWPRRRWPPMVLDSGLVVGGAARHGPIHYLVERYEPGRRVTFRFTRPRGWSGTHEFAVTPLGTNGARLAHRLEMETTPAGFLLWVALFRPLHDALIEDALHRAAVDSGSEPPTTPSWSPYVRFLRGVLRACARERA